MTLMETMVAMGIGSIIIAVVASLSLYSARSFAALTNYADLDRQSRNTLDSMSWKIRNAASLTTYNTNYLLFSYLGGTLSYTYSSTNKTLTENLNGTTKVLLKDCNSLTFTIYQRTTVSGTFDQYSTTNASLAKAVQVSWQCSRSILGSLINSESVQSAKVIMRN